MDDATRSMLIEAAQRVRQHAYCPYSEFAVGAALLDDQGNVHVGVNVENASYPVGTCAERTAVCSAVTAGARSFVALALVTASEKSVAPCGMCRQALLEFAPTLPMILATPSGSWQETTLDAILGMQLDPKAVTTNRNG